ncbi:MAG TPA: two-component regulator propeller domain-containing protein, partial [Puia sp.]|nr:two-component regulator propeller domain-containing protein [Puia sp.]
MRKFANATHYQLRSFCFGFLIIILSAPLPIGAQSRGADAGLPFITNYAPRTFKALPQVWAIQEDDRGIMYFGVQNYVLEYDGIKWRKISLPYNPSAVVRSFAKYRDGHIYFGGFGELGYLDRDSLGQTVARSLVAQIPEKNRDFFDVWSTYATDNGIYFQSREYVFRFQERKADKGPKWNIRIWKPKTRFMYAFYLEGDYYVHQQGLGLFKMINDSLELVPGSEFLGKERVQVMLPYPPGPNGERQYLIGMFYSGLYIYNGSTFRPFPTKADPIIKSGVVLYKGIRLNNGNYILSSTGKGLIIIDPQGNLIEKIDRNIGLQDESVYTAYFDSRGILWLGLDNGVSRVDINSPLTQFGLQSGITAGVLNAFRFEGRMYVGTSNGLLDYDSNSRLFHLVPGVAQNQVFSFVSDGKEMVVAGDGLFEIRNNKTVVVRPSVSGDMTLAYICTLKKHPGVFLSGALYGIPVFEVDENGVYSNGGKKMNYLGNIPGCSDQIWTFSEDSDGTMWAGTQNSKVFRIKLAFDSLNHLDLRKTKVEQYGPEQGVNGLLGSVFNLSGKTYFLTDSSLLRFDNDRKKFIVDTTFGRFPNGGASLEAAFAADSLGRVWIRIGKETRLAVPKPGGGYTLDESRLKSLTEHTVQAIYPEKNGILWMCTTDGLIRYDEKLEKNRNYSFKTILRHIEAGSTTVSTAVNNNETGFQIASSNNTLRFEYAAPFFEQEEKMKYQTWLQGFEKEWSGLDVNYYKEYTNLSPGKYTFHVRASNIYQDESEEATYSFEILAPWYRTGWAWLVYALAAGGLLVLIIRWRTRQLQQKHRELEKIVEERTTQLSHRLEELAVINSVQEGLARETNMEGIYELVGDKLRQIFQAQVIDIVTFDKKSGTIEDRYSFEKGDRSLLGPRPLGGFRKKVIESAQPLLLDGKMVENPADFDNPVVLGEKPKSAMFVPLVSGSEATGVISIQNIDRENAFSGSDLSLLSTLGNSMSIALESAKRFDETKRLLKVMEQRTAELAVINSVQEGLVRELNIQGIYDLVGERIRQIFDAQVIDIVTYDPRVNLISDKYSFEKGDRSLVGPREPRGFRKYVIDTKKTLVFNEDLERHSA